MQSSVVASHGAQPLVVTLAIDGGAQARFDAERRQHFPRTEVGAHVTLFHALPGAALAAVHDALRSAADRDPFEVAVESVGPLGSGVAYWLDSADLLAVHAALRTSFAAMLTRQDAQGFRPHITVQNKVSAERARATLAVLRDAFVPLTVRALGLDLWRYLDGPWEAIERVDFGADYG